MTWFANWFDSPYYHLLYFDRDEQEAGAFIDALTSHLHMPYGDKTLDVACGKGRHAKHLADLGFDVTGIDLSPYSIQEAKKMENDRLRFFVHDMREPFMPGHFDHTFNLFTSFGYFLTQADNDKAMHMMTSSLKPSGTLVIDYLNAAHAITHSIPQSEKIIDGVTFGIKKWYDDFHFYKEITVSEPNLNEPLVFTEKVARFSLEHFKAMLLKQGFELKEVFGNYQLQAYDQNYSPRMVMIANKI